MTTPAERLNLAADRLDYLYEGAKHIPTDLEHSEEKRGLVTSPEQTIRGAVAQFYYGGAADVFLALGPTVLPLLAKWLRAEADDVAMFDAINSRDPDNDGKTRSLYRDTVSPALAFADHILKEDS